MVGVFLLKLLNNIENKDIYHTGLLGGFTSLSTIILVNQYIVVLLVNIVMGIVIYKLVKPIENSVLWYYFFLSRR